MVLNPLARNIEYFMNRTGSTSSQRSYVLEVGVIIGGMLGQPAFRHDCRIVTLGVVIVGTEETEAQAGRTHCRVAIHTNSRLGDLHDKESGTAPNLN